MAKKSKGTKAIQVSPRRDNLKRRLRRHLKLIGLRHGKDGALEPIGAGKDVIRSLHHAQRNARLREAKPFISERLPELIAHFAEGKDIDPARISPRLERITAGTWQSDLFRLACLTWAVPVSNGFGRRLRYLVWDEHNGKLMGLIAIGDPVFNLSARDNLIGWNAHDRAERLVGVMDAYVLGALPPYNMLLGGKLIASLVRSRDIYDDFTAAYGSTAGIISGKEKKARLLMVTTSSALGRSSVYNRLKLGETIYFRPIGFTGGWGHFHIPDDLFGELRSYLEETGHPAANHRFGQGPNWRLRTTRAALKALGFREDLLRHGVQREVFLCELAANAIALLHRGKGKPDLSTLLSAKEVARLAVERWVVPRSERRNEYLAWRHADLKALLAERRRPFAVMQTDLSTEKA
jgi:hypothetical protein